MTENAAELGLALVLGAVIALARWRAYRWSRTPLGQAELAFRRRRLERERQRVALEGGAPRWTAALAMLWIAFLAWAASRSLL